ncbi:MAG: DUF1015 family protein [Deltaproteobacteria bacterium]
MRISPFAALRPQPELAARVAAVPYDVVNTEEARRLAEGNPLSFLHVSRSEIDLPANTNPYSDAVYQRALSNLRWLEREALLREAAPSTYVYRQETTLLGKAVRQSSLVCCGHVEEYESGIIKRHEKTRRDKEDDRTRHVLTLKANAGPVFLMYRDRSSIDQLIEREVSSAPLYDFVAPDGVRHQVWRCVDAQPFVNEFAKVDVSYIADGHHRAASAARAGVELRASNPRHEGSERYNWFLCALFPASQLTILPYHRVVKDLAGLSPAGLIEKLKQVGTVALTSNPEPPAPGSFCVYVQKQWYQVSFAPHSIDAEDPVGSLDYSLLGDRVLGPILGIGDIRSDQRIDFVGGIRGPGELVQRVDSGRDAVAFSMHATTIEHLLRVADADQIMPPKSTWFEPKLRSGLLLHSLD